MAIAIVAGAIANKPYNGGEAWVRLSWILGLRRLGFDVYFAEILSTRACVDESGRPAPFQSSVNKRYFEEVVDDFGLADRSVLLDERGRSLCGLDARALTGSLAEAEVIFELSGHLCDLVRTDLAGTRVYVDLDPGFTQAWHTDPTLRFTLSGYDRYVTVGLNVGSAGCTVPAAGLEWIPTLPPVVLEEWAGEPASSGPEEDRPWRFTTVTRWRGAHGPIQVGGRTLGLKHHEFRRLLDLPKRVDGPRFELAADIGEEDARDLRALQENGWSVVDPREVVATPRAFRDYLQGSGGEFSVAQPAYVQTRSGWFSDRTAAYLAAGRPALVQDTAIGSIALGEGLLTFSSQSQALEGVRRIVADPAYHSEAARALARRHLDSDLVLGGLLDALRLGG